MTRKLMSVTSCSAIAVAFAGLLAPGTASAGPPLCEAPEYTFYKSGSTVHATATKYCESGNVNLSVSITTYQCFEFPFGSPQYVCGQYPIVTGTGHVSVDCSRSNEFHHSKLPAAIKC